MAAHIIHLTKGQKKALQAKRAKVAAREAAKQKKIQARYKAQIKALDAKDAKAREKIRLRAVKAKNKAYDAKKKALERETAKYIAKIRKTLTKERNQREAKKVSKGAGLATKAVPISVRTNKSGGSQTLTYEFWSVEKLAALMAEIAKTNPDAVIQVAFQAFEGASVTESNHYISDRYSVTYSRKTLVRDMILKGWSGSGKIKAYLFL